jgi:hypothetical protein
MKLIDFPIERINKFLKNHTFTISDPLGFEIESMSLDVKVKLTGTKKYIKVGEWTDYVEYTIYVISGSSDGIRIFNLMWSSNSGENTYIMNTSDVKYYRLTRLVNDYLEDFLEYFDVKYHLFATKIVNELI